MNRLAFSLFAFAALVTPRLQSQLPDAAKVVGRWSGTGHFFKPELQKKIDSLPFVAEFTTVGSGNGRLGEATLKDVHITSTPNHIEIRAILAGSVGADPAFAKNYLVVLITKVTDRTLEGEFHLKSNSFFDPSMREGRFLLTRQ